MTRVVAAAFLTALALAALAVWLAPRVPEGVVASVSATESAVADPSAAAVGARSLRVAPAMASEAEVGAAAPAELAVPLSDLLRMPASAPPAPSEGVGWAENRPAAAEVEKTQPGRVRIDYSKEKMLDDVPTQDNRQRTDVGVAVRVDSSDKMRVKGGVRVDERQPTAAERTSETTPTVGVEVRF